MVIRVSIKKLYIHRSRSILFKTYTFFVLAVHNLKLIHSSFS
ncbi:unnamed protein product, partial [Rotaria magnacalcarata]